MEGSVVPVDDGDWSDLFDALDGSAWFPSTLPATGPGREFLGYCLAVEQATGHEGGFAPDE